MHLGSSTGCLHLHKPTLYQDEVIFPNLSSSTPSFQDLPHSTSQACPLIRTKPCRLAARTIFFVSNPLHLLIHKEKNEEVPAWSEGSITRHLLGQQIQPKKRPRAQQKPCSPQHPWTNPAVLQGSMCWCYLWAQQVLSPCRWAYRCLVKLCEHGIYTEQVQLLQETKPILLALYQQGHFRGRAKAWSHSGDVQCPLAGP